MGSMRTLALLLLGLLVACAPATEEPSSASPPPAIGLPTAQGQATAERATDEPELIATATAAEATAAPSVAPVVEATASPPPAATPTPSSPIAGRNDDGTYFFSAPDAPVTLTDYSDFL